MEGHILVEKLSQALQCKDNDDAILDAVKNILRDLLDAQDRIRALESQVKQSRDRDRELISLLKCEHYETPESAARRHVKREQELQEFLEEAHGLIDPYGDCEGTLVDVVKRIRDDLEIDPDGGATSIRDGIMAASESASAKLEALKREHTDGDACEMAGRILGHALAAMLERPKQ